MFGFYFPPRKMASVSVCTGRALARVRCLNSLTRAKVALLSCQSNILADVLSWPPPPVILSASSWEAPSATSKQSISSDRAHLKLHSFPIKHILHIPAHPPPRPDHIPIPPHTHRSHGRASHQGRAWNVLLRTPRQIRARHGLAQSQDGRRRPLRRRWRPRHVSWRQARVACEAPLLPRRALEGP